MKKRFSVVWLIIFLCSIIFGLFALWGYNWHLRQTAALRQEIESLKNKSEILPSILPLLKPKSEVTESGKKN